MASRILRVGGAGRLVPPVENVLREAREAEEQGFAALWWPDLLMSLFPDATWTPDMSEFAGEQPNPHLYLDPVAAMSAVAVHTDRILLGTAVTEAVRRHPAMLARAFLSLDHLSKGRVILGIGPGQRRHTEPYGADYSRPASRLAEALAIVRLLWEHKEPVSFAGDFWRLRDAVLGLDPYRAGRFPPIWIAAHEQRTMEATGRYGDGWLPTYMPVDEYGEKLAAIRAVAAAHGRDGDAIVGGMWAYCVLAGSHEECHRLLEHPMIKTLTLVNSYKNFARHGAGHPLGERFNGMRDFVPTRYDRAAIVQAVERVPLEVVHEVVLHGTPDEIVAELAMYAARGLEHVILWNLTHLADLRAARASSEMVVDIARRVHRSAPKP